MTEYLVISIDAIFEIFILDHVAVNQIDKLKYLVVQFKRHEIDTEIRKNVHMGRKVLQLNSFYFML